MRVPEAHQHWGVLGGLFDPVHRGHIALAAGICDAAKLDGVLLVPSFSPPHRNHKFGASYEERLAMLSLAIEGSEQLAVSDVERHLSAPGYTLHTLEELRKRFAASQFSFIIGADNLPQFTSWHKWREILEVAPLLVGTRPGNDFEAPAEIPRGRVRLIGVEPHDVSSTEVRRRTADGIEISELARLVPDAVAQYICEHGLYQ